jgi:hypothetical protein
MVGQEWVGEMGRPDSARKGDGDEECERDDAHTQVEKCILVARGAPEPHEGQK